MSGSIHKLSQDEFHKLWLAAGERDDELTFSTAWKRRQQIQQPQYKAYAEEDHASIDQIRVYFEPIFQHQDITPLCQQHIYLTLPASTIPWTPTGINVRNDQPISIFAAGRTWRSKLLDIYLTPQFNLWYRIGVNGLIFNSTHDTKTFKCIEDQGGELYIANQFPGSFHDRKGGRVGGNLSAYDHAEGTLNLLIIQWQQGISIPKLTSTLQKMLEISHDLGQRSPNTSDDPVNLLMTALERTSSDYFAHRFPVGWTLLWFLGVSEIFSLQSEESKDNSTSQALIHCKPNQNVGILQKDLRSSALLLQKNTSASWSWNITSLPSRLREDTALSHDYLSIAFEFENGRDLTYVWSWELPIGYGFWCPLATWCDREYHIVIRSGTEELGTWLDEKRNIYDDYIMYINNNDESKPIPSQIVRVWLIAGNRWQRHRGEMLIKQIKLHNDGDEDVVVL